MSEVYHQISTLLDEGRRVAVATIIEARGSTPQGLGGKMLITDEGETFFSIGGGALEAMVIKEARGCLAEGKSALRQYALSDVGDDALGMACGGRATVFIEVTSPPDTLLIVGAGHVGRALARLAPGLGFRLEVVDDRSAMLDPEAFPRGARLHRTDRRFRENLPAVTSATYVVIVTRCHETDELALQSLLEFPAAYLGMIGSKRKVRVVFERMAEGGTPQPLLDRVHAPIGLPIGSHLPEEVAVSIIAEIIAVRNGLPGGKPPA